jgi:hypothetical protein
MRPHRLALAAVLSLFPAALFAAPAAAPAAEATYERLDIAEKRITEGPYIAALERVVADERGLRVRVGAALFAARIDVLLRNVKGTYSFRADLSELRPGSSPSTPPRQQGDLR